MKRQKASDFVHTNIAGCSKAMKAKRHVKGKCNQIQFPSTKAVNEYSNFSAVDCNDCDISKYSTAIQSHYYLEEFVWVFDSVINMAFTIVVFLVKNWRRFEEMLHCCNYGKKQFRLILEWA